MPAVQTGSDCCYSYHGTVVAAARGQFTSRCRYFQARFKVATTAVTLCSIVLLGHGVSAAFVSPSLHSTAAAAWEYSSRTSSFGRTAKFFSWRGLTAGQSGRRGGLWTRLIRSEGILQHGIIATQVKSFRKGCCCWLTLFVSVEVQQSRCMS